VIENPHTDGVSAIAANDTYMITGGRDGAVLLWRLTDLAVVIKIQFKHDTYLSDWVRGVFLQALPVLKQDLIGIGYKSTIYMWDLSTGKPSAALTNLLVPTPTITAEAVNLKAEFISMIKYDDDVFEINTNSNYAFVREKTNTLSCIDLITRKFESLAERFPFNIEHYCVNDMFLIVSNRQNHDILILDSNPPYTKLSNYRIENLSLIAASPEFCLTIDKSNKLNQFGLLQGPTQVSSSQKFWTEYDKPIAICNTYYYAIKLASYPQNKIGVYHFDKSGNDT
jgi:hypothetical protein